MTTNGTEMDVQVDSIASIIVRTVERCLLSIVLIFVATILVGVTMKAGNTDAPRTVELHTHSAEAAATH